MRRRTFRLFILLVGTCVFLFTTTAGTLHAGQLAPQQATPPEDGQPLTQEALEAFWQEMYATEESFGIAAHTNVYARELLAKASPDECFVGIGETPDDTQTLPDCEGGVPKVNEAYVWGMTDYLDTIWFGTAPNVHCLVMGSYLDLSFSAQTDSYVCEFEDSTYAPYLPGFLGDWRPPKLYIYDNASDTLTDISPNGLTGYGPDPLFNLTLGIRSAATFGDYVFFAGPALSEEPSINIFLYNAATQTYVGSINLEEYGNVRKWIVVDDVLYVAVRKGFSDGAVLRYTGNPASADPIERFTFEEVGLLGEDGAEIALHDGRLFVNTWPIDPLEGDIGGIWMSPVIPQGGLTEADADNWEKVFSYDEYEPDPLIASTYAGGALHSYNGELYFGTMHIPFLATMAHIIMYSVYGDHYPDDEDILAALPQIILGSQRAAVIFKGSNFGTPEQVIEVAYGMPQVPAFDPESGMWQIEDTLLGPPLYGTAGFGNLFNNYTWAMAEYDGQLFVGTMDWSYLLTDMLNSLITYVEYLVELPLELEIVLPQTNSGADLFRFYDTTEPALAEDVEGVGNYTNYGIRNMISRPEGLYLGMANPMNLLTDLTDDKPEGGWELLRLTRHLVSLDVNLSGNGSGRVDSDLEGISCGITCTTSYDYGTFVTLIPTADPGSTFTGWSGVCPSLATCNLELLESAVVTAHFTLDKHNLHVALAGEGAGSVLSDPAGINCGTACDTLVDYGTSVTLTATANPGSNFIGWEGACSGTDPCAVTITDATNVTATFANNSYTLTVVLDGNGSGSVDSAPAGISCGVTCTAPFDFGTSVTLTPTAAPGSTFAGWSGVCPSLEICNLQISESTVVTALFTLNTHTLNVALAGDGEGTVVSDPAGIDCGVNCTASYDFDTSVTLTATAAAGSLFIGWEGACSGTLPCTVAVTDTTNVTATFANNLFALQVDLAGDGSGSVESDPAGISCGITCTAPYDHGTSVTLTATADEGSVFTGWEGACSGTEPCEVTINGLTNVTATFANNRFPLEVHIVGGGSGHVASLPAGITCSQAVCSADFDNGTQVTLNAIAFSGSSFEAWSGACSGMDACQVVIGPGTTVVTASFNVNTTGSTLEVSGLPLIGESLFFTASLNLNPINECTWDFGDGTTEECDLPASAADTSATQDVTIHATHVYAQAGVYVVIVTASNDAGTVTAARQLSIQVPTATPPNQQPGSPDKLFFPFLNRE